MGKMVTGPKRKQPRRQKIAKPALITSAGEVIHLTPAKLSTQEKAKRRRFIAYLKRRVREGKRMTPQEKAQADADWERLKRSINEERARAGARLMFVE
jgi:hypothetical protein